MNLNRLLTYTQVLFVTYIIPIQEGTADKDEASIQEILVHEEREEIETVKPILSSMTEEPHSSGTRKK